MPELIGKFEIHEACIIKGRGTTLFGQIIEGRIYNNDLIIFDYKGDIVKHRIKSVEMLTSNNPNMNVGIILKEHQKNKMIETEEWEPNKIVAKIIRLK